MADVSNQIMEKAVVVADHETLCLVQISLVKGIDRILEVVALRGNVQESYLVGDNLTRHIGNHEPGCNHLKAPLLHLLNANFPYFSDGCRKFHTRFDGRPYAAVESFES